jgi:hypothetical protein
MAMPVMLVLVVLISLVQSILLMVGPHHSAKLRVKRDKVIAKTEDHRFVARARKSRVLRPFVWVAPVLPGLYLPAVFLAHVLKYHPWASAIAFGLMNWVGFALMTRIPLPAVSIPEWVWAAFLTVGLIHYYRCALMARFAPVFMRTAD